MFRCESTKCFKEIDNINELVSITITDMKTNKTIGLWLCTECNKKVAAMLKPALNYNQVAARVRFKEKYKEEVVA